MDRMKIFLIIFMLGFVLIPLSSSHSQVKRFHDCSAVARQNINLAFQYLINNIDLLVNDYEFDTGLPRRDDRIRRRMRREINDNMIVDCPNSDDFRCRGTQTGGSGGVLSDKIHICFDKFTNFCTLVGVIAHEFAHSIGMPRDVGGHNISDAIDPVRMFGFFATDLCIQDNINSPLPITSFTPSPTVASSGIIVFSKEQFHNIGRNITSDNEDLRFIGRDDSVSSIQVLSGTWEVCRKTHFRDWCLELSTGQQIDNLGPHDMKNRISSIRSVSLPRSGITLFRDRNNTGLMHNFTESNRDLSQMELNDQASSITIFSGDWEVCRKKDFRDCVRIDSNISDLRTIGLNDKITSIRRLP